MTVEDVFKKLAEICTEVNSTNLEYNATIEACQVLEPKEKTFEFRCIKVMVEKK